MKKLVLVLSCALCSCVLGPHRNVIEAHWHKCAKHGLDTVSYAYANDVYDIWYVNGTLVVKEQNHFHENK